ncbi:MAG: 1-acyl-sn-glycerol-3-phosphate acyltransferase [Cyanobacteria bacterium REEB459]|nr:1-acyl-sn-glycerol-3-phosphate acyltransferase [Cyanobacteria bacterium REEB459]
MSSFQTLQPPLKFIPHHYRDWVRRGGYALLPLLLRVRLQPWLPAGIWPVTCKNPELLVKALHQFQSGETRLLLAFRHSQVDDPLCLAYLFSRLVPQTARQQGQPLRQPIHSFFMYDRGMPLWAGAWLEWFFASLGGVPVHRGRRLDLKALKTVRHYLLAGQFPLTIAPEGATNGHGEVISPLEAGTAQLAFWGVEDLAKAQRSERVMLLPIGLQYFYPQPDWCALDRLLSGLEADCGLPEGGRPDLHGRSPQAYYQRLAHLGSHLLTQMEGFYGQFYGQLWPEAQTPDRLDLGDRLQPLLERALTIAEAFFHLPGQDSLENRCRQLEEAGWARIYREDMGNLANLSPFDRGLADWIAQTASLHMRHMRLVESFVAVTGDYVKTRPSFERLAETSLILFDLVERVKGTPVPRRPQMGRRHAVITLADPIDVSQRWPAYRASRTAAKAAVAQLTEDLQTALEGLVEQT